MQTNLNELSEAIFRNNQKKMKNREIKFRVWDGYDMVEDVTVGKHGAFWTSGISESDNQSLGNTTKYDCYLAVMQFTGLHDKNGKEIYEGDILKYESRHPKHEGKFFNNVVEFASGQSLVGWRMRNKSTVVKATPFKFMDSEIIGNIHTTPELLNP